MRGIVENCSEHTVTLEVNKVAVQLFHIPTGDQLSLIHTGALAEPFQKPPCILSGLLLRSQIQLQPSDGEASAESSKMPLPDF